MAHKESQREGEEMTQNARLLNYLESHDGITTLEAAFKFRNGTDAAPAWLR